MILTKTQWPEHRLVPAIQREFVMNVARVTAASVGLFFVCCCDGAFAGTPDWPMFGQNAANTASNSQG
jgi:hypothetical protein